MTSEVIDCAALFFDSRTSRMIRLESEGEKAMTDVKQVALRYIELWNERAPTRRREMLAANWTSDATYVDPLMSGDGHDGVDALISGVQQKFPDFRFSLIGEPSGFADRVRFSWGLG